ncbi:hypothetical protein ACWDAO_40700, partial [Streptomyces sp. NPDC001212]
AAVAASGKLAVCDVAELNPDLDADHRTARAGAAPPMGTRVRGGAERVTVSGKKSLPRLNTTTCAVRTKCRAAAQ